MSAPRENPLRHLARLAPRFRRLTRAGHRERPHLRREAVRPGIEVDLNTGLTVQG